MLILPGTIATYFVGSRIAIVASVARFVSNTFNPGGSNRRAYWLFYFVLVVAVTFFYTLVIPPAAVYCREPGRVPGMKPFWRWRIVAQ
jgi:hypothetical protein